MSKAQTSPIFQGFAIVTSISSILLGVLYYLKSIEVNQARSSSIEFEKQNRLLTEQVFDLQDQQQKFKDALAYPQAEVGSFVSADPLTLLGSLRNDIDSLGLSPDPQNVHDAILQWKQVNDKNNKEEKTLQTQLSEVRNLLNSLETRWMTLLDVEKKHHTETRKELADVVTSKTEMIEGKNRELNDYRQNLNKAQQRLSTLEAEFNSKNKEWNEREKIMQQSITRMRSQIATLKGEAGQSQEPDAEIVKMEGFTKTVWLNRGSKDKLKPGVIFVITAGRDVEKGKEKGRVRVTKIVGEHLAEAKIIDTPNNATPLTGDHLISNLWSPGQTEKFVLTGMFDVDDDGKSDIDILISFVKSTGAEVVAYGDDEGRHVGGKFDEDVTALIVGKVPDPALAKTEKTKNLANAIMNHSSIMRKSADDYGTEIVTMKKFLQQIGYPNKAEKP